MVKKLPTIERSKTVSIGHNILDNQATNTVVINASDEYINTDSNNAVSYTHLTLPTICSV